MFKHLLAAFFVLSTNIEANQTIYLNLDNETIASYENLIEDPFLILRAELPRHHLSPNPKEEGAAWRRAAQLQSISSAEYDLEEMPRPLSESINPVQANLDGLFVSVTNIDHLFDHISPTFSLKVDAPFCNRVWWQISTEPDFSFILSNFDIIQDFSTSITLDLLDETFLNSDKDYFFRTKICSYDTAWSNWSAPFHFNIIKPKPVNNPHFEKIDDAHFELVWEGNDSSNYTYLVFGSNSLDFVPSIYGQFQANALIQSEIAESNPPQNFLGEATRSRYSIDGRFAYYRIVAKHQGVFSNPSPIISFYDSSFHHERNVLRLEDPDAEIALRMTMPSAYPWMQAYSNALNAWTYVKNAEVTEEVWQQIQPYLLPENHPAKKALDHIFSQSRVLDSSKAMKEAGFKLLKHKEKKTMKIARHPKLKGYLIKAYLDSENMPEWFWWKKRIDGAQVIQKCIDKHGYQTIMKVPKKWIYPLPPQPAGKTANPRQSILIVEDMKLLSAEKNLAEYKKHMTPATLDALYIMFMENLLIDSVYADNVPFSKDGKIAFIDTEHFNDTTKPVKLCRFAQYLSSEMHAYWEGLLIRGGPGK